MNVATRSGRTSAWPIRQVLRKPTLSEAKYTSCELLTSTWPTAETIARESSTTPDSDGVDDHRHTEQPKFGVIDTGTEQRGAACTGCVG